MGKSKDGHKLKRSSPSPRDGDESRSKRHRSKDDDKEQKSSKKHKSHYSSKRHSRKEKKSSGKHKGQKLDKASIEELSGDDYFSKNNEFATWLKEEKRIFFSDLSSDAARTLFSEFVREWNSQELEPHYYTGITTAPRTSHKWNIKN